MIVLIILTYANTDKLLMCSVDKDPLLMDELLDVNLNQVIFKYCNTQICFPHSYSSSVTQGLNKLSIGG